MTPEELNRTVEFLIQHQAQFSVRMDQLAEHMDQLTFHVTEGSVRHERDFEWSKGLLSRIFELAEMQSSRLHLQDRILQQNEEAHRQFWAEWRNDAEEARNRHEEALARLDRILEKLTDRKN